LLTEQLMDFQLMVAARERCGDAASIAAFFGRYYGITSAIGTFLLFAISGRVLARLGAPQTLVITPIATIITASVAAIWPGFGTFVALRGTDRVLKSAIWTTATEQVQTPLGATQRSQSRALVRGVLGPLAYGTLAVVLGMLPDGLDMRWVAVGTGAGVTVLGAVILLACAARTFARCKRRSTIASSSSTIRTAPRNTSSIAKPVARSRASSPRAMTIARRSPPSFSPTRAAPRSTRSSRRKPSPIRTPRCASTRSKDCRAPENGSPRSRSARAKTP